MGVHFLFPVSLCLYSLHTKQKQVSKLYVFFLLIVCLFERQSAAEVGAAMEREGGKGERKERGKEEGGREIETPSAGSLPK